MATGMDMATGILTKPTLRVTTPRPRRLTPAVSSNTTAVSSNTTVVGNPATAIPPPTTRRIAVLPTSQDLAIDETGDVNKLVGPNLSSDRSLARRVER